MRGGRIQIFLVEWESGLGLPNKQGRRKVFVAGMATWPVNQLFYSIYSIAIQEIKTFLQNLRHNISVTPITFRANHTALHLYKLDCFAAYSQEYAWEEMFYWLRRPGSVQSMFVSIQLQTSTISHVFYNRAQHSVLAQCACQIFSMWFSPTCTWVLVWL